MVGATPDSQLLLRPFSNMADPQKKVDAGWKLDDATHIKFKKPKGFPSALCWWHTFSGFEVAIIGTSLGEIVFVDLHTKRLLTSTTIQSYIVKLDLVLDDDQMHCYLLVTSKKGAQWKLLLEKINHQEWQKELEVASGKSKDDPYFDVVSIIDRAAGYRDLFWPVYFPQFGRSVQLSPQYAKGRQLIAAHCCRTCSYQIFDCSIQRSPLYVYKLPLGAHNTVFTDKIIFLNTWQDGKKLLLLSNQKAETLPGSQQILSKEAVLQTFDLPCDEKVLGIVRKCFPFYWHEKQEASLNQSHTEMTSDINPYAIHIASHTVFDGCLVITESAVYECRPRISPERYFLQLALHPVDSSNVDSMAVSLGLDFNNLFQLATDHLLTRGYFARAVRLFKMAKCSYVKRVASFASYGCIQEVMIYVQHILRKSSHEITTFEAKRLSDIAFYGYIHIIKSGKGKNTSLISSFREFLLCNFFYNETNALKVLAEWRWPKLLLEVGRARGLVVESLELLMQHGIYNVDVSLWKDLVEKGFGAYLCDVGHGVFLHCLSAEELVDLLCLRPQLAVLQVELLKQHLKELDTERLLKLAEVFDPSKYVVRGHLSCQRLQFDRTFSQTSGSSLLSLNFGEMPNPQMSLSSTQKMVDFFFEVILLLNKQRDSETSIANLCRELIPRPLITEHVTFVEEMPKKNDSLLPCQPSLVGCGNGFVAMARNGDLFTWGRSQSGCLGHGALTADDSIMPVCRVETLHMLKICILGVACGGEHVVALSSQGIYSWGSSKYGQVGVGTNHHYSRPMLVESLSTEVCVSVVCGQYHSMALTNTGKVFTWGWGVHGQLGHNDAENQLVPTFVKSLPIAKEIRSIQLAAGYAHSLVLSQQGDVYAFGCGYFGQLGLGKRQKKSIPSHVPLPEKISVIATNFFNSIAVTQDSNLYIWGIHPNVIRYAAQMSRRSQCQDGGDEFGDDYLSPMLVDTSNVLGKVIEVSCGSYHSALLTSDGAVYTWGRNTDGQLGFVSYQNILYPTQLAAISDTIVSHIYSGSDYNIAINTDAEVWGWGKNDCGQLIHFTVKEKGARPKPKSILHRDEAQHVNATHVRVPILLPGIPSNKGPSMFVNYASTSSDAFFESDDTYQVSRVHIPDLASVGLLKYGRQVIPVLLRYIPDWCQPLSLLQRCIHQQDWKLAINITLHMKQYSQALAFHLMLITDSIDNLSEDLIVPLSTQVLEFYMSRMLNQEMTAVSKDGCIHFALLQILNYWKKHDLPSAALEAFFDQYFDDFAPSLGLILLRDNSLIEEGPSRSTGSISSVFSASNFRELFSAAYLLKIVSSIINQINMDVNKSSSKVSPVVKRMLQSFNDYTTMGITPSDKLIPYLRLWNDIIQNICKMSDVHNSIAISHPEVQHLLSMPAAAASHSSNNTDSQSEAGSPPQDNSDRPNVSLKIVAFTCGHHFLEHSLKNDILVNLNNTLAKEKQLPQSATLLTDCYSKFGMVPLACPRCVQQTV